MGSKLSRAWKKLFSKKEAKVLMLGLDSAGKTTILYRIKLNLTLETIPTMGFVYEKIEHKKFVLNVWDVAGQDTLRPLWKQYFDGTNAIIFVIDSSDQSRFDLVREELHGIIKNNTIEDAVLVIAANKMDMSELSVSEIVERMDLSRFKNRKIKSFGVVAITGQGLPEMMDWLANNIKSSKKRKTSNI